MTKAELLRFLDEAQKHLSDAYDIAEAGNVDGGVCLAKCANQALTRLQRAYSEQKDKAA